MSEGGRSDDDDCILEEIFNMRLADDGNTASETAVLDAPVPTSTAAAATTTQADAIAPSPPRQAASTPPAPPSTGSTDVTFSSNSTSASVTFGGKKVVACLSFLSGSCKREDCRFVHLKPNIRLLPTSVCAYQASGGCKRGALCRYFHGSADDLKAMKAKGIIMYNPMTNKAYDTIPDELEDPLERQRHRREQQQAQEARQHGAMAQRWQQQQQAMPMHMVMPSMGAPMMMMAPQVMMMAPNGGYMQPMMGGMQPMMQMMPTMTYMMPQQQPQMFPGGAYMVDASGMNSGAAAWGGMQ